MATFDEGGGDGARSYVNPPQVHITLDHMRQQLVHSFGIHTVEMQQAFDAAVTEAVTRFDYYAAVKREAESLLDAELRSHIKRALWEPEVQLALRAALVRLADKETELYRGPDDRPARKGRRRG